MVTIIEVITVFLTLMAGSVLGYFARQTIARQQAGTIEAKLDRLTTDAKQEAKEFILKAKDKAAEILEEIKRARDG